MAVHIPVVIDIDQAFEDAAKRVKTAINPLQEAIDAAPASLMIDIKVPGEGKKFLKDLFERPTTSAKQFESALDQINVKIDKLAAKGGFSLNNGLVEEERLLLNAATLLERKLTGVGNESTAMARVLSINMKQAESALAGYTAKIDQLTLKLNKTRNASSRKRIENNIQRINMEIQQTRKFLGACSIELDNITKGSQRAGVAVKQVATEAQMMANSWRQGQVYLNNWNAALGTANSKLATFIKSSLTLLSISAMSRFARNVREVTAELELQRVSLGSILQDTDKASELFREIKAAALKSPFEIKDLVTYTKQLSAYRIETDKLFDTTMRLADISAGLGVDMNRLILAYGQVRAAAVLRGQELRQFTEAGIPLVEKLAEKFQQLGREGTTTADVFELISQRAVPFSMIEEIFNDMTSAGGEFYNMQEKQSATLWGRWQKLKDAVTIMYDEIGNTKQVHKAMEDLLSFAMNLMKNWRETGRVLAAVVSAMAAYKIALVNARIAAAALTKQEAAEISALELNVVGRSKLIASIFGETAATKAQVAAGNLYVAVKRRETAATNILTKSLYRMIAALLSNPYAAAGAAIIGLAVGISRLAKSSKDAAFSVDALESSVSEMQTSVKRMEDTERLIGIYEELSQKAERTAEEQKQLTRTAKELASTFPDAVRGFDEENQVIDINISRVRELTAAEEELLKAKLKKDEQDSRSRLNELTARRREINQAMKDNDKWSLTHNFWTAIFGGNINEKDKAAAYAELEEIMIEIDRIKTSMKELEEMDPFFVGPKPAANKPAERMLANWKQEILKIQDEKAAAGATMLFQEKDLENCESVLKFSKQLKEQYEKINADLVANQNLLASATDATRDSIKATIKADEETLKMIEAMRTALGIIFKSSGGSKRDSRLQDLKNDISEVTNAYKKFQELKKYKSEDEALIEIDKLFPQLSGWKPTFDNLLKKLEGMRDDVRAKIAKNPKDKTLLDMQRALDTEISNLSFEKLKKDIDDKLKKLSDDIKRSETARNFFQNILDLTGDEQMAATMSVSVYGGIGEDFKQRMQRQLNEALKGLDASQMTDEIRKALETGDFKTIMNNLEKFPPEYQKLLGDVADAEQAFHAKQMEEWLKDVQRTKTYAEKRLEIVQKTAHRISEINESTLPQQQKDLLISQYNQKQAKDLAKLEYEAFKDSPIYIRMFEELDAVSTKALGNMRERLVALKSQWKDLDPTELKEMQRRLDELDEQLAVRNPFKAIAKGISDYRKLVKSSGTRSVVDATAIGADTNRKVQEDKLRQEEEAYALAKKEYDTAMALYGADSAQARKAKETLDATRTRLFLQKQLVDRSKQEADAAEETSRKYDAAIKAIMDGVKGLQEWAGYVSDAGAGIHDIMDTFASEEATETFDTIMEGIQKTAAGAGDLLVGTAKLMGGDIFGGISSIVKGLGGVIAGIFGTAKKLKIAELNRQIEVQARLLDDLAESYSNLEEALGKSFGSDYIYNYNQQLKNLVAQQKAAEEQLRLEKAKGNKASKDQIAEYEKAIREASKSISEMEGKLSEFFTGTDLTSASSQFANSWIEAYKTFSSTTAAMQEEFNSMVQNMVSNSIGAKLVQSILGPLFKQIDEMAASGGEFSASEIAQIAQEAPQYIDQINNAMTTMMNQLGAAGYNMRRQVGGFTGISRNIANASEESINGLAAGINTQNFYISYVPLIYADVALIREKLAGTTANVAGTGGGEEGPSYQDQMLMYVASLPVIRDDMAAIRAMLDRVIKPVGVKSSHYVSVNM